MNNRNRIINILTVTLCILPVVGCQGVRESFGLNRHQPDAFDAPVRMPLKLPTSETIDFDNIQNSNDYDHTLSAQKLLNTPGLSPTDPVQTSSSSILIQTVSLRYKVDPQIRNKLNIDTKDPGIKKSWIQKMLFWQDSDSKEDVINPHLERQNKLK